jgi:hypothetical protein
MDVTIKVRNEQAAHRLLVDIRNRAPFAVALACNKVADGVQAEVRKGLGSRFTLRRKLFVEQTIYRNKATDFAKKDRLQAIVRVNPERDFLVKHEDGGDKGPRSGLHVAIPTTKVRPQFSQVVKANLRLSALRGQSNVRKITTNAGTFLVRDVKGRGKAGRGARTDFLYALKRSVRIRPRLRFLDTAGRVVDRNAVPDMLKAIDEALRGALSS